MPRSRASCAKTSGRSGGDEVAEYEEGIVKEEEEEVEEEEEEEEEVVVDGG